MSQINLGSSLSNARELLSLAQSKNFVNAGHVAIEGVFEILDQLLAIDAKSPLRFTVETADIVDTEVGEKTGTQSRLVGQWWIDVPEQMPMSPGNS